jgi:hypothetical protein
MYHDVPIIRDTVPAVKFTLHAVDGNVTPFSTTDVTALIGWLVSSTVDLPPSKTSDTVAGMIGAARNSITVVAAEQNRRSSSSLAVDAEEIFNASLASASEIILLRSDGLTSNASENAPALVPVITHRIT